MQGNRPLAVLLSLIALAGVIYTLQMSENPENLPPSGIPSKVMIVNGYPEFHVDNKPFFMHSAAFYYYRMPRDRWEESLRTLKKHGINTIDLYIIWNWHQPSEETLDLDGRTNPRRDLKGLLKLIADLKFKLSVRPGPFICSEWKNGGYPDWLLLKDEYQNHLKPEHIMPLKDILEGRYPRLSALQYEFSEEAATGYLNNPTHLRYTRKWYEDVMDVVRPYLASRGGNVILLQVDDDQGLDRYNYNGPKFWEYMNLLRQYLREASRDQTIPIYFNPADMRVTAASSAPPGVAPFWAMGQYYQEEGFGSDVLRAEDSSNAKFLTEILKTQPGFPPFFIEYQAGWFAGAEDVRARATDPTNTLLSSRFLFQNGVKGLNYFPLQDTLFPAGYECPWSNYFYSWESAIGYEGDRRPRAEASMRNGKLIQGLGPLLAASHYVADIGIAHTIGTYPQEKLTRDDISSIIFRTMSATQYAQFNQVNAELVDLDYQSLQHLQRYSMILVPVLSESSYKNGKMPDYLEFSIRAQSILREYTRQGGTVVAYPVPPKARYLEDLFPAQSNTLLNSGAPVTPIQLEGQSAFSPGSIHVYQLSEMGKNARPYATLGGDPTKVVGYRVTYGKGSAIVLGAEFDRWVPLRSATNGLDGTLPQQPVLTDDQKKGTAQVLEALLKAARISRVASSAALESGLPAQQPFLSLLASNATTTTGRGSAYGFLCITNFGSNPHALQPAVRDPRTGEALPLPAFEVAGRDALMLPLRLRLKEEHLGLEDQENLGPHDEIFYSTAEITAVRAMTNSLVLDLYNRGKASLRLRLDHAPSGSPSIGAEKVEYRYYPATKFLDLDVPPAKDASGRQVLTIRYGPLKTSPKSPSAPWHPPVNIQPTIRVPVRSDVSYALFPATRIVRNNQAVEFSFLHPPDCKGKCTAKVSAGDVLVSEVNAEQNPAFTLRAPSERTYIRNFDWSLENAGQIYSGAGQVVFLAPGSAVAVERDVDRDGFFDYILENEQLRLILYPHAGARSFALIRKDTNTNGFTSIGGMRDLFRVQMPDPPKHDRLPAWTQHGTPGMHNRFYEGRINQESGEYAEVTLSYDAPDVAPSGAILERTVRLAGASDFVDVTYKITPKDPKPKQGYVNLNSVALGSMEDERATVLRSDRSGDITLRKRTKGVVSASTWVALASRDGKELFGMTWTPGTFETVVYDRRDYSLLLSLQSGLWEPEEKEHTYRIRYLYAPDTPQARQFLLAGPHRLK